MEHLSLAELSQLIQKTLKDHLDPSYWVIAEIGDLSINQKGHCYLELIENHENKIIAKSRATIWSYTYRNLSTWFQGITGQPLTEGMKILANVKINYHELYGFSLNIQDIDANYTLGEKERIKQETINRLVAEGVFEMNKELLLPTVPQQVAIVSSPTAAGFGDFLHQLDNNPYQYRVNTELFPAIMQGSEAPDSIVAALHKLLSKSQFDLVVLVRGGGSQLDLECFNDYNLCAHIAQFPIPVVTGIGHERDDTIADMVANTKMKTPTAVAEFILQGFMDFDAQLEELARVISRDATRIINTANLSLEGIGSRINQQAKSILSYEDSKLSGLFERIKILVDRQLHDHEFHLSSVARIHQSLDPKNTLKRGYTFTTRQGVSIAGKRLKENESIVTYSIEQIIESTTTKISENDQI